MNWERNIMPVNPAKVEKCLKGLDFPADKETIRNYAMSQCCDSIRILDKLPEKDYSRPTDVTKAIGEIM